MRVNKRITLIIGGMPVTKFQGECRRCGKGFISNSNSQKYCSDECAQHGYGEGVCTHCGETFEKRSAKQAFCSAKCQRDAAASRLGDSQEREKRRMLRAFMEEMAGSNVKAEGTESDAYKAEPDTVYPDGCIFVHTSSNAGYWVKASTI